MDLVLGLKDFIIIDNYERDAMIFIAPELSKTKIVNYYCETITPQVVEDIIREFFEDEGYDVEDIIEEFRISQLYPVMKENEDGEN